MPDLHTLYSEQRMAQLALEINELSPRVGQAWKAVREHRQAAGFDGRTEGDDHLVPGLAPLAAYAVGLEDRLLRLTAALCALQAELEGDEFAEGDELFDEGPA